MSISDVGKSDICMDKPVQHKHVQQNLEPGNYVQSNLC